MKILLIDNGTSLLKKLEVLLPEAVVVRVLEGIPTDVNETFDLVVLSGSSRFSVLWNHLELENEINFVRNGRVPIIGICFGCELIAYAFGGELKELAARDKGLMEIELLDSALLPKAKATVYESHRWAIDKLPEGFSVLAKSKDGPEIIAHKSLPIYGLQFHPENFVDESDGDEIFASLLARVQNR